LKEHRPTPERPSPGEPALDARVEELTRRLVSVVNGATPEQRPALREYALELLREGTEIGDTVQAPPAGATGARATGSNPIGIALLLGMLALPALLLFPPVGLVLLAVAGVMGVWGVASILLAR